MYLYDWSEWLNEQMDMALNPQKEKEEKDVIEVGDTVKLVRIDTTNTVYVSDMVNYLQCVGKVRRFWNKRHILASFEEDALNYMYPVEWLELVEKAKKPLNCKVVCIETSIVSSVVWNPGKVYPLKDGIIYTQKIIDDGSLVPFSDRKFYSIEDLNNATWCKFIEFKGEN